MKYGCLGVIVLLIVALIVIVALAFARGAFHGGHNGACITCGGNSGQ